MCTNADMAGTESCTICEELSGRKNTGLYYEWAKQAGYAAGSRILYEDRLFVVMPSLGPIAECHLLIVPKQHVCSYAVLEEEALHLAEKLIEKAVGYVRKKYGGCIVFEHGTTDEKIQSSASCTHAHMHIVSSSESILTQLMREKLEMKSIEKLTDLREEKVGYKTAYFYYREGMREAYLIKDTVHKSQYLRILLANAIGKPQRGDWKKNPGICAVEKMLKEIREDEEWNELYCSS